MLDHSSVTANIPAADLARARRYYSEVLGLDPTDENPGGLVFTTTTGTSFYLYETEHAGKAGHTIAQWHVADVPGMVRDLEGRGVEFEHFEAPGMSWDGSVASMEGMGHAAWFKDSEGNTMCIDEVRA